MIIENAGKNIFRPSSLIEGYWISDGKIFSFEKKNCMSDVQITDVGFNQRALNCLHRDGCFYLSELLLYTESQLSALSGVGAGVLENLKQTLSKFLSENLSCTSEDIIGSFEVIHYESLFTDEPITSFDFSNRVQNALQRAGYKSISEIADMTYEDFLNIRNMGVKAAQELFDKVQEYKETHSAQEDIFDSKSAVFVVSDRYIVDVDSIKNLLKLQDNPHISKVSRLTSMTDNELEAIAAAGVTVKAIKAELKRYISNAKNKYKLKPSSEENREQIDNLLKMVSELKTDLELCGIKTILGKIDSLIERIKDGDLVLLRTIKTLDDIYESGTVIKTLSDHILNKLELNEIEGCSLSEIADFMPRSLANDKIKSLIDILSNNESIYAHDGRYYLKRSSFEQIIKEDDHRYADVVRKRISGLTLDEIGTILSGVTRERIRQLESRYMKRLLEKHPVLLEDKYAPVFCKYEMPDELLQDFVGLSAEAVYYLNLKYKDKKGSEPLEGCLSDALIPISVKKAVEKYFRKYRILINNEYVEARVRVLEDKLYQSFCSDEITADEFFEKFNNFVRERGFPELVVEEDNKNTRENKHMASDKILWKLNRRMRYYDTTTLNREEFYQALNLEQYEDVELSAKKIYEDNFLLMCDYDIRDEYELHNLLKKTLDKDMYPQVSFGRTPVIAFGNADRSKQVEELLFELAPVSQVDFVKEYSQRYGVAENTVSANYLGCISKYSNSGKFDVAVTTFSAEEICELKKLFCADFYFIDNIKRIYTRQYPDESTSRINHYTLRQLGYRIYSGYVVSDRYSNAYEYFESLLNSSDVFEIRNLPDRILSIQGFYSLLNRYAANYDLIEYSPKKYVSFKRLNQMFGTTKDDFRKFCEAVKTFANGSYFTIASIKSEGFTSELDELGFEPHFYASILSENKEIFAFRKYGNNKVFKATTKELKISDFVEWLLYREETLSMDIYELTELLNEKYRLNIDKYKLFYDVLPGTSMYYNEITEKVYADYEIYFDEI